MTYIPRSPRRTTKLSAIVDGNVGRVRDMSTSGLFVEGSSALAVGRQVAVVPLVGDLDGERLPAEVARVGEKGLALRFVGLDTEHRQRLRAIMNGDEHSLVAPAKSAPLPSVPDDAPVVLLTDEGPAVSDDADLKTQIEELEAQLLEVIRDKSTLLDENTRLKRTITALQARNTLLLRAQDDLLEAQEKLLEVERARDALVLEVRRLEAAQAEPPLS